MSTTPAPSPTPHPEPGDVLRFKRGEKRLSATVDRVATARLVMARDPEGEKGFV